jgi:hypothetical protein
LSILLDLPANIKLGWKDMPRTNTLAYMAVGRNEEKISAFRPAPGFAGKH